MYCRLHTLLSSFQKLWNQTLTTKHSVRQASHWGHCGFGEPQQQSWENDSSSRSLFLYPPPHPVFFHTGLCSSCPHFPTSLCASNLGFRRIWLVLELFVNGCALHYSTVSGSLTAGTMFHASSDPPKILTEYLAHSNHSINVRKTGLL